jgi:hypothetical protein
MARVEAGEGGALERWAAIEPRLRVLEESYRVERIRKNGRRYPEGESLRQLEEDVRSACEIYMETTAEHRAGMRALFDWSYLLIPRYLNACAMIPRVIVDRASAVQSLRLALAAASLADQNAEIRDLYVHLGAAWVMFERAGIDPRPMFREAADWSSTVDQPVGIPIRRFLLEFEDSAFFHSSVLPRLRGG